MKAREVKKLDPDGGLADQLEKIVRVRTDELTGFMPRASDPNEVEALHDLRIAAKRLRYVLELSEHLFGPYAKAAAKRTKEVQDLVGEIHDCDVTIPRAKALRHRLTREDVEAAKGRDGDAAGLPNAEAHRGAATYEVWLRARRDLLFEEFLVLWRELEREGFAARLAYAVGERAPSHAVDSDPPADGDASGQA